MIHDSPKRTWSSRRPSNGATRAELKRQVLTSEMPYFNTPSLNSDVAGGQPEADASQHDTPAAGGPVLTYDLGPVAQAASPVVPANPSPTYLPAAATGPQAGPPDVVPTWSAPPESAPPQPQAAVSPPWTAPPGSVPPVQPAAVSPPPPNAPPSTAQVPQPLAYTPAPTWSPPSPTPTVAEQPQAVTVGDTNLVNNPPAAAASAQGAAGNPSSSDSPAIGPSPSPDTTAAWSSTDESSSSVQSDWWAPSDSATTSASATDASVMGAKASVQPTAASTSTWSDSSATALQTLAPSTWSPAPTSTDSSVTAASWSSSWSSSAMDSSSASPTTMATSTPAQVAVPTATDSAEASISPLTAVATASSSDGAALQTGTPNAQNRRLFANTAAHVGIAVGAVILVACLVALGAWLYRLGRRNRQQRDAEKLSWPFDNQANGNASGSSFEVVRARTARPAQDNFDYGYHFGRDLDAGEPKRTPSWYESQSSRSAGPSPIRNPFSASISPTSAGSGGTRGLMDLSLLPPPLPLEMYDSPTLPMRAHAGPRVSVPIPPPILPGQPATPIIASPYSNRNLVRFRPGMEGGVPQSGSVPSLGERSVEERQRMLGPLQVANYAEGERRTMSSVHSSPRTVGGSTPRMGMERPRFLALQDGGLSHPWEARRGLADESATDSPSVYSNQTPVYPLATPSQLEAQGGPGSPPPDPWTTSLTATLKSNIVNAFNTIAALRGESAYEDEEARDKFTSLPARSVLRSKRRSVRSVDWQADHSEAESASSGDITRWSTVCSTRAQRGGVVIEETVPGRGVVHIAQGDVVSPTRARAMRDQEAAAAYGGMSRSASGESVLAYYGADKRAPRLPSIIPMSRGSTEWSQRSAATTTTSGGLSRNGSENGEGWLTEDEKKAKVILKERRKRRSMMGR